MGAESRSRRTPDSIAQIASGSRYALRSDLNKLFAPRNLVALPLPLALDLDAALRYWLSGEPQIERLQRVAALIQKCLHAHGSLFIGGRIRALIRMGTGQDTWMPVIRE
jgi:hypothetical protein